MGLEIIGGVTLYRVWGCGSGKGTSVLLELYTAARVAIMVWYVDSEDGSLHLTEGHRPRGVPSDRNARREQDTSLGISTQYYQHGRYLRWLAGDPTGTPSAINPDVRDSNHTGGRALDSNAPTTRDMQLRAEGAALAGLVFNVASESWHCEPLLPVPDSVDLGPWIEFVKGETPPAAPAPTPKDLKKESTTMTRMFREKGNKGQIFVIGGGGAGYIKHPDHVAEIAEMNRISGLTGPSWSEPADVPWYYITHLSESLQEGSLATAILAELRSWIGTPSKPGILTRIDKTLTATGDVVKLIQSAVGIRK